MRSTIPDARRRATAAYREATRVGRRIGGGRSDGTDGSRRASQGQMVTRCASGQTGRGGAVYGAPVGGREEKEEGAVRAGPERGADAVKSGPVGRRRGTALALTGPARLLPVALSSFRTLSCLRSPSARDLIRRRS